MEKYVFEKSKKSFIKACKEYAEKAELVKISVIKHDIAISTFDLIALLKGKKTAESLLRSAWCFKHFDIPVSAKAIPLYGDITDIYKLWRNSISFPELYSMTHVYNYDIFSLDEDGFPCVDMNKAETEANRLYVKEVSKEAEEQIKTFETIANIMTDSIDHEAIKAYIHRNSDGSYSFDKATYLRYM